MENREQQILSEIKAMMGAIRSQLEMLDAKMAELQQCVDPEDFDNNPIELDIDLAAAAETKPAVQEQLIQEPEPVVEPDPVAEAEPVVEPVQPVVEPVQPVVEPVSSVESEVFAEPEVFAVPQPEEDDDDLPFGDNLSEVFNPVVALNDSPAVAAAVVTTVAEAMADKHAWRTDMPGSTVKDVRSAISLNDRIIFINRLFDEDPLSFQNAITRINSMTTLDEVVAYVTAEHPQWDLSSDLVYRFMMAVRRRVK